MQSNRESRVSHIKDGCGLFRSPWLQPFCHAKCNRTRALWYPHRHLVATVAFAEVKPVSNVNCKKTEWNWFVFVNIYLFVFSIKGSWQRLNHSPPYLGGIIASDATHPQCVFSFSFLFTDRVSLAFMLLHADLLFLPAVGAIGPLPILTINNK